MFDQALPEMLAAVRGSLSTLGLFALAALALVGAEAGAAKASTRVRASVRWVLLLAAAAGGLYLAWQRLWLCDDAFISFRYSENLAAGNGLVFNPGEWVEGYTNFLWTALLGGLGWLGVDIPTAGLFGNLASFVGVLWLTAAVVKRAAPAGPTIPFSSLALAGSIGFTTFASSGLETMPAAMLVMAGVWASTLSRPTLSGLLFVLAAMTRPDHLLFWGCMGLAMAAEDAWFNDGPLLKRARWGRYLRFTAPLLLVYVPYFLLRWRAYGDLFPNTYYAKSGNLTYYAQGVIYGAVFLATSGAWVWISGFVLAALGKPRSGHELRLRVFALLAMLIFGHYVVKVGGDFMQDRFFVVLWPIVLSALELTLRWRLAAGARGHRWWLAPLGAVAAAAVITPVELIKPYEKKWHVAAEYTFYRVKSISPLVVGSRYYRQGQKYAEVFADVDKASARMAIGCVGMVGYYSDLPLVDAYGLTNRRIAHLPLERRGRPGHEKRGRVHDVLAEGAVIGGVDYWGKGWRKLTRIQLGDGESVYLVREAPELRKALAKVKGVRLPSPPDETLRKALSNPSRRERVEAWRFFKQFLQAPRHTKRLAQLEASLGAVADFELGLPPETTIEGSLRHVRRRPPPGGSGAGWLHGDGKGTGRMSFPVDLTGHRELRFALGGTQSPELRVELHDAAGAVLRSASPTGAALTTVRWPVADVNQATVVIIDALDKHGSRLDVDAFRVPVQTNLMARLRATRTTSQLVRLLTAADDELALDDPELAALLAERLQARWTFDGPNWPVGTTAEGTAFGPGPSRARLPKQQRIEGRQGLGLANSFHGLDQATGRLVLPPITVPRAPIALRVAGGKDCTKVFVGLMVEGKIVARACGRKDEILRPAVLRADRFAGKPGNVVIVDRAKGAWGHLLVDDLLVPKYQPPAQAPLAPISPLPKIAPPP